MSKSAAPPMLAFDTPLALERRFGVSRYVIERQVYAGFVKTARLACGRLVWCSDDVEQIAEQRREHPASDAAA